MSLVEKLGLTSGFSSLFNGRRETSSQRNEPITHRAPTGQVETPLVQLSQAEVLIETKPIVAATAMAPKKKYTFSQAQASQASGMLERSGMELPLETNLVDILQTYSTLQDAQYPKEGEPLKERIIRSDQEVLANALAETLGVGTAFMYKSRYPNIFPGEAKILEMIDREIQDLTPKEKVELGKTIVELASIQRKTDGQNVKEETIFDLAIHLRGHIAASSQESQMR
jgi:hypothetical protein